MISKSRFLAFKLLRINKNENQRNFFQSRRHISRDKRYAIFINAFKARGILNSHRNNKVHGNLIMRLALKGINTSVICYFHV